MLKLIKSEYLNVFVNQLINPLLQTMIEIDYDEKSHNNLIISIMHIGYIKYFYANGMCDKNSVEFELTRQFKNINLEDIKKISKNRYIIIINSHYNDFDYNLCELQENISVLKIKEDEMDITIISFDFQNKDRDKIYNIFEQIIKECNKCDKFFYKKIGIT